jgi:hypothetical protein
MSIGLLLAWVAGAAWLLVRSVIAIQPAPRRDSSPSLSIRMRLT